MRSISKGILSVLLGATVLTPVAAEAQDRGDRGGWARGQASDPGQRTWGGNERSGRQPERAAPAQAPQQAQAPRPEREPRAQFEGRARADGEGRQRPDNRGLNRGDAQARAQVDQTQRQQWQNRGDDRRNDRREDWRNDRRDGDRHDRDWRDGDRRAGARQDWRSDNRSWNGNDRRDWSRDWRNDRRYGWQDYRNSNRRVFRMPRYVAPRYGYTYRRWSPGYRIDPWFYGADYWISDPFYYRLPPAYGDYRWVRYYDDVALVDVRTGLIVDIIYSFFLR